MKIIVWNAIPQKVGDHPVHWATLGGARVASVSYTDAAKGEVPSYTFQLYLPSLKAEYRTGKLQTLEEAKARVEKSVATWFKIVS